jgi:hypothetical protein
LNPPVFSGSADCRRVTGAFSVSADSREFISGLFSADLGWKDRGVQEALVRDGDAVGRKKSGGRPPHSKGVRCARSMVSGVPGSSGWMALFRDGVAERSIVGRRGWSGVGKSGGIGKHVLPLFKLVVEFVFLSDAGDGVEEELADVGEQSSVADRNAVLRDGSEELAEDEVDIGGGQEVTGDGGRDFRANLMGFEELLLGASVKRTELGMIAAEHAATAAVGEGELAERGFDLGREGVWIVGGGAFSGHEKTSK